MASFSKSVTMNQQTTCDIPSRGRNVPDCLPVSSERQNVFYLSPPTSNLNNIFLILFYFHFLKLNWGCTIINNKLIESNDLRVRKRSILRTRAWSAKKHRSKTHLPSLSCALQRLHHLAFIQYWVKSGKDCARAARLRTTSGGKTDENIIQINKFCITKVLLTVASDRHEYCLPVTFWKYLKSTGRRQHFNPCHLKGIFWSML